MLRPLMLLPPTDPFLACPAAASRSLFCRKVKLDPACERAAGDCAPEDWPERAGGGRREVTSFGEVPVAGGEDERVDAWDLFVDLGILLSSRYHLIATIGQQLQRIRDDGA